MINIKNEVEMSTISEKMEKALNEQLNAEICSSYLYLSMAAYFENISYNGFSNWMRLQSEEEYSHAMKIYDYINRVGGRVVLDKIDKPEHEWDSPLHIFEGTLEHEIYITNRINDLANLAVEEKDHATNIFINWFITEQVEEVGTVQDIVDQFKLVGDDNRGLFFLDKELGKRAGVAEG
jgi:ferritin